METPAYFDPNTGKPVYDEEKKKNNIPLIIGIIVGAVFVFIGILIGINLIVSGNGKKQSLLAISNTYNEFVDHNSLIKTIDSEQIVKDKDYTIQVDFDTEVGLVGDISVLSDIMVHKDEVQISGDINLSFIPNIEYILQMDENELRLSIPMFDKYMFVYNYNENNDGYINAYTDTEALNTALRQAFDTFSGEETNVESMMSFASKIKKEFDSIEYSSEKPRTYEIDGKEVKCNGYTFVITPENLNNIIDAYEEVAGDLIYDEISKYGYGGEEEIKEDILLTVYIYKKELAGLVIDNNIEKFDVAFKGGDFRAQNLNITLDDKDFMTLTGTSDGDIEKFTVKIGSDIWGYIFDSSEGDLTLRYNRYDVNMNIDRSRDELKIKVDYFDLGDTYFGGKISLKKGTDFDSMSGEELDIGKATEDDVNGLIQEVYSMVMGLMGW